jgi:hypothetical protein
MQDLRDKLLKAGLVSAQQVTDAARPPPDAAPTATGPLIAVRREPLSTSVPKLPPLPGSRAAQRLESKKQLETDRQLAERVAEAEVALCAGGRAFYFVTRKNRLRRLELSLEQAAALESGALAVVEKPLPGQLAHALVPAAQAESLLRDFPKAVRFLNQPGQPVGFLSEAELQARQTAEGTEGSQGPEAEAADSPGP